MAHRIRRILLRLAPVPLVLLLGAPDCGSSDPLPPGPQENSVFRYWEFSQISRNGGVTQVEAPGSQIGGVVDDEHVFGPLLIFPLGADPDAKGEVFSSENGFTYWATATAPRSTTPVGTAIVGSQTELGQVQYFRKTEANATLSMVISRTWLETIDSNGGIPLPFECPWHDGTSFSDCVRVLRAWATFKTSAVRFPEDETFFVSGGFVELNGWAGNFGIEAYTDGDATRPLWDRDAFDFDPDVSDVGGSNAQVSLPQEITIHIPLGSVAVGQDFAVISTLTAGAINHRQRESYVSSYLRDPVATDGLAMEYVGLTRLETPATPHEHAPPTAAPACSPTNPAAGTLELTADTLAVPELPGPGAIVVVRRVGGSTGPVSARLVASAGTAAAGSDFTAVDTQVLFDDGELGERAVRIPLVTDDDEEPDETVTVRLSEPRGCAALGAATTATLTIQDDDRDTTLPTFTVGGEVQGLDGSGLVLREVKSGFDLTPTADGPFAFSYQHPDGSDYEVRIITQPQNPFQVCTVANGTGAIAGADVTNVQVTCTTVTGNGALDPGFGEGGKVTGALSDIDALTLAPDGKIVAVGDRALMRFLSDGRLDPGFGTGGVVTLGWGGIAEEVHAVAIQPDGKIVVAGQSRTVGDTGDDFAVARFLADGSPDGSFDGDGKLTLDFAGSTDRAWAVLVEPDGELVIAGHAAVPVTAGTGSDFAALRLSSAGVLDAGFGKVTVNIAGATDLAAAAALQPDGKIVIVGRVAQGGGDNPDVGIVRLLPTGALDGSFGSAGVVRRGVVPGWDEATDVVLAPDGKIVVAVKASVGPLFEMAVARFLADGSPDGGFGSGGFVSTAFSAKNDFSTGVALDAAGRVIVVGQQSNLERPDFAIARYLDGGGLDDSFGTGGKLGVDFFAGGDVAECVAVQPDGKIVVGGVASNGTSVGGALVRVLP